MVKDDLWSDPEDVVYDDKVSTGLVKQKVNTPANYAPNSKFNNVAGSKESTPNVSLSTEQTKIYTRHENRLPEPNYFNSSQLNLDTTSFDHIASKNTQTNITSSSTFDPSSVSTVLISSSITREDPWRSYSEKSIVLEPFTRIEESVTLVPNAAIPDTNPDMQASSFTNDHAGSTLEIEEDLWVTPGEHQNRDEELLLDAPDDVEMLFLLDVKNNTQTSFVSDFEDTPSTFRDFEETSSLREFENALESDPLLYSFQLLDIEAELAELERIETELATQQFKAEHSTIVIGRRGMVQAPGWMGSSSVLHINWENEEEAKQEALERLGYSKLNISEATRDFVIQAARACRLTHQEELALTTRLEQARSHLNQLPDLDIYETKRSELQAEIAGLERTLVYNLQWVAVKKAPQFLGLGVELDDLIQYGILGIFA